MTEAGPVVLVVDDDPSMLRMLARMLEAAGYTVRQASDGREALAMVEHDCPDVVITDWMMPGIDGPELCRRLRQAPLARYVYVALLTSRDDYGSMTTGIQAGADDFLTKPVVREALLARLHAAERVLQLERRLREMAHHDALTGIPTRRLFMQEFDREVSRAQRYHLPTACVLVDIDFFKRINDSYGHAAGDAILKTVAETLSTACRTSDYVCRYGGEEFCVMLPETNETNAALWSDRVRKLLGSLEFNTPDGTLRISASMGVAELLGDQMDLEEVIDRADQALLVAKQTGRDRVVAYSSLEDDGPLRGEGAAALRDWFEGVTAADVMVAPIVSLSSSSLLAEAADFFCRYRVNSAPVVDAAGKLCGILSEKDVLAVMLLPGAWDKRVTDVMRSNVVYYDESAPARRIYDFLCRVTIRRVIVARDGFPVGVISRGNLLRWYFARVKSALPGATGDDGTERTGARCHMLDTAEHLSSVTSQLPLKLRSATHDCLPVVTDYARHAQQLLDELTIAARETSTTPAAGDLLALR